MKQGISFLAAIFVLTGGAQAWAQNLGDAGQVAISAERLMGISADSVKVEDSEGGVTSEDTTKRTTVALLGTGIGGIESATLGLLPRIGVDFFPIQGLSLGISGMVVSGWGKSESKLSGGGMTDESEDRDPVTTMYLVHPRIGYAIQAGSNLALWPRLGITQMGWSAKEKEGDSEYKYSISATALSPEFLVAVSPAPHFAIMFGPYADIGVGGKVKSEDKEPGVPTDETEADLKATSFGLVLSLGGYFP